MKTTNQKWTENDWSRSHFLRREIANENTHKRRSEISDDKQIDAHTWREVELHILGGTTNFSDNVVANCIKWLASDWLHYREAGLEIVASSYRDRLAAIVEAMKEHD
jgi:hypothetical protein